MIFSTDDIYIKTIEEDVEEIINENRIKITNKKKIFNLDKIKHNNNIENKKSNHLRTEAKILEESIKDLELPTYQELKTKKYLECHLFSYHFFKHFYKKEIGKENNYIFNFRDNFLNDMTKIDKEFFDDYFHFEKKSKAFDITDIKLNNDLVNINNRELIYEFAIYHPLKNTKTQQISIAGSCYLYELKDKIYCVVDELHTNCQSAFFFIENSFYNDTRSEQSKNLSSRILENKLRKLNIDNSSNISNFNYKNEDKSENSNNYAYTDKKFSQDSKLEYKTELYCVEEKISNSEIYEESSMNDLTINEIPIRIGYPYLYKHIDHCDHMIMLIDIRLSDSYDKFTQNESDGKCLVTYQKKLKRRICDACLFYYAKFMSLNDPIGGEMNKIIFLCESCLKRLHEKEIKENTIGGLKLIPYYHD